MIDALMLFALKVFFFAIQRETFKTFAFWYQSKDIASYSNAGLSFFSFAWIPLLNIPLNQNEMQKWEDFVMLVNYFRSICMCKTERWNSASIYKYNFISSIIYSCLRFFQLFPAWCVNWLHIVVQKCIFCFIVGSSIWNSLFLRTEVSI